MASTAVLSQIPPQSPDHTPSPTTKRYTFTPRPNSKVPRAWERKPSTPFAPRNESQKIWKRYEFPDTNNDHPTGGIRETKTTESRAIKKLRLGGHKAIAHITTWDEELHEARHKESIYQSSETTLFPSSTDPTTTAVAPNNDTEACTQTPNALPNTTQIVKSESATDGLNTDQEKSTFRVDSSPVNEVLEEVGPDDTLTCGSPPEEKAMTAQPDLEPNQDPEEQNLNTQLRTSPGHLPPPTEFCEVDARGPSNLTNTHEEDQVRAVGSLTGSCTLGERGTGSEQTIGGAAELKVEVAAEETAGDRTNIECPSQVTKVDHHSPPSQSETIVEAVGGLRGSGSQGIPPQVEGADSGRSGSGISPQTEGAGSSYEEALTLTNVSQSAQDEATDGGYKATRDSKGQEHNRITSSPCQDLPTQSQHQPSKLLPVVQDEDADYLHAFLTRAKAKKAAREESPNKVDRVPPSPMTRSRAALLQLSTNSPSPKKTVQHQLDTSNESELLETNRAGSPCRRSARTRLPRPQKTPTVATSTIPVRRSNGTEFIFLQSTESAQLALATKTNTKRNKGEALIPKVKLQALSQAQLSPCKSPRPRKGKGVSWKDEPIFFGEETDEMEEAGEKRKEEDKPRLRKIRRLGAANGTPAPKKTRAEDAMEVRRPVSGKRSKAIKP